MPEVNTSGPLTRLDTTKPEDAQVLVTNGYAWKSGPRTMQRIIRHIVDGTVTRNPTRETPEVTAYLDKVLGSQPVEPTIGEPVEPDMEDLGAPPA